MKLAEKIGFVGGGRMAEALIRGILRAGLVDADQIIAVDPSKERRDLLQKEYGVSVSEDGATIWSECTIVILAVKPQIIAEVLKSFRGQIKERHLVISIAAGIPLSLLEARMAGSGCRVIRVMPNTPAIVQQGASALSPGKGVTREELDKVKQIFDAVGSSVILDESLLDAVTGLSGSGPAYVFTFIEALVDAGLKVGLSKQVAETLALQTVLGSVTLALESRMHPAELRAMVTSPGGTTIAGLHELEKAGFRGIVMNAVETATRRSRELGQAIAPEQKD